MENIVISFLSQKGGVGKSTLTCLLAVELIKNEVKAAIIDIDVAQTSCHQWVKAREQNGYQPVVPVLTLADFKSSQNIFPKDHTLIVDTPGKATMQSLNIARESDLIILPVSSSSKDLAPQAQLAFELQGNGILDEKISFLFNSTFESENEHMYAVEYLRNLQGKFYVFKNWLPTRTAWMKAGNMGKALTETAHNSLNDRGKKVVEEVFSILDNSI